MFSMVHMSFWAYSNMCPNFDANIGTKIDELKEV